MSKIFLVRHGQASLGAEDYDVLSPLGAEQSRLLGAWFRSCGVSFDVAVTGRHKRHRQSALECMPLVADGTRDVALAVDPGFDEYAQHDVLRFAEPRLDTPERLANWLADQSETPQRAFQRVFSTAFQRWLAGCHEDDYAESWRAFRASCVASVERLAKSCASGQNAIVFTSGGPITAICQHLLGIPDARVADLHFSVLNTSVTKLLCQPGRIGLSYYNSVAHLEQTGRRNAITYR